MPREVIVAGENREETRKKWAFHAKVSDALTKKGFELGRVDWDAVEKLRHEGLTPAAVAKRVVPAKGRGSGPSGSAVSSEAVLKAVRDEQNASAMGTAYLPRVAARLRPAVSPEAFRGAVHDLASSGRVVLHHHDRPSSIPAAERQWMPTTPDGTTFHVAFLAGPTGAEEDRSALGDTCGGCSAPAATPTDSGFSKVVKDEAKFAALLARAKAVGPLDNDGQLYRFIREDLVNQDQEIFYVVGLDSHNGLRCVSEVARGQRDRVAVDVADVLRVVLIEGCKAFAVAHNHPAGNPIPSASDKTLTARIEAAAPKVGVIFLDHLVVGTGSYYSFRDKKTKKG
jgi:hypothetical protein